MMEDDRIDNLENEMMCELGIRLNYNSGIIQDILDIVNCIKDGKFLTGISKELKLQENYIELIQYLLCNKDLCEYGTSPRGCWFTDKGKQFYEKYKKLEMTCSTCRHFNPANINEEIYCDYKENYVSIEDSCDKWEGR